MSSPRLLLDADVPVILASALRSRGYDAVHAREGGHGRASDAQVLEAAVRQRRAVFTHNVADFMELAHEYGARGDRHFGVLVAAQRPVGQVLAGLLRVLSNRTAESLIDAVVWVPR